MLQNVLDDLLLTGSWQESKKARFTHRSLRGSAQQTGNGEAKVQDAGLCPQPARAPEPPEPPEPPQSLCLPVLGALRKSPAGPHRIAQSEKPRQRLGPRTWESLTSLHSEGKASSATDQDSELWTDRSPVLDCLLATQAILGTSSRGPSPRDGLHLHTYIQKYSGTSGLLPIIILTAKESLR